MKRITQLAIVLTLLCATSSAFALDAPTLTISTSGLDITASWTSVSGATGYTLYYAPYPYLGDHTIGSMDMDTDTYFDITLWDGASYYVAITVSNGSGESEYSNIEQFIISVDQLICTAGCGPALGMPNYECSDGMTIAGPGDCVEQEDGNCGWEIITCPDGCTYDSQWYVPGESFPAIDMCNTCYCQGDGSISCTEKACLEECTGGQVWNYCGSACTATCSEPYPICTYQCVAKCECPPDTPLWDGNQCIKPSDCVLCPDGNDPVTCFAAPCDVSTCSAYPNAECIDNYCGGCSAEYYVDGKKVDCKTTR